MRSENTLRPRALAWLRNWVWVMMWTAILTSLPPRWSSSWAWRPSSSRLSTRSGAGGCWRLCR